MFEKKNAGFLKLEEYINLSFDLFYRIKLLLRKKLYPDKNHKRHVKKYLKSFVDEIELAI